MIRYKRKKVTISIITSIIIILSSFQISFGDEAFRVESKSAILIDATSGKLIYEKNIHEKLPPASVTKIMVLLLAMEALENDKISLEDEVVISPRASSMGGSQIYLEAGEVQKVEPLIRAIALRSANDAAVALGEHISGSEELFINLMNERAKELGMNNTNFVNTNGLPDENHYTTAYDISIMSKELISHKEVHKWLTLWTSEVKVGKNKDKVQSLANTNKLIRDYKGANGLKTGFTNDAGHCLAASATRGNLTLISVVLGAPSSTIRFNDSKKLLDYGFANYDSLPIVRKDEVITNLKISKGNRENIDIITKDNYSLLLKKGESKDIDKEIILPDIIDAPIEKDTKVGEIIFKKGNTELGRVDLITKENVEKATLLEMIKKVFSKILVN